MYCVPESKSQQARACQTRTISSREDLFQDLHTDLIGPLPETEDGYHYILTAIDRATRYPIAVPLKSTETTEVWQKFQDNWISTFGVPDLLISDRGSQFTSSFWAERCKMFGIRCSTTNSQDGHKPPLAAAYKGPYRVKSKRSHS